MNDAIDHCSDDRLRLLLESNGADADYQDVAAHLDTCESCQRRIETLAADDASWVQARNALDLDDTETCIEREQQDRDWYSQAGRNVSNSRAERLTQHLLAPPSHPEMLGRLGRYEIERVIGQGGMGIVFKAFDSDLNRPVAIKVLAPHLTDCGASRARFAREARAAASVVHEHVVPIHDVVSDSETPYLVMHYVAGESLQTRIDREGPLHVLEVLQIARQTALGMASAHAQGLVHRDVKPSNILLELSVERTLLTDFGLARATDDASLTHSGFHPGTPQFMSPEQARGETVDARSDLFSLGSVMYAMCTGHPPFRAETAWGILRRITDDEPRPLRQQNPELPPWLCAIVSRLLSKSPKDRYDSAGEVATLLEDCLAHVQQPDSVPLPAAAPTGRSRLVYVLFATAITAIVATGFAWFAQMNSVGPAVPDTFETTRNTAEQPESTLTPTVEAPGQTNFDWEQSERLDALETELRNLRSELFPVNDEQPTP